MFRRSYKNNFCKGNAYKGNACKGNACKGMSVIFPREMRVIRKINACNS